MDKKWTDLAFKILSALVIPLLLWGVRLEVNQAVQNEKIDRLETQVVKAEMVKESVAENKQQLGRMEEKLNAANQNLSEIKGLVRDLGK
jgi:uncharacterized coiled-coil protein SlyX